MSGELIGALSGDYIVVAGSFTGGASPSSGINPLTGSGFTVSVDESDNITVLAGDRGDVVFSNLVSACFHPDLAVLSSHIVTDNGSGEVGVVFKNDSGATMSMDGVNVRFVLIFERG